MVPKTAELEKKAAWVRAQILETALKAGKGHIPPAFSSVELLVSLYYGKLLSVDPQNPSWKDRDRFILSKGHGCLSLYVILADLGFYPMEELSKFAGHGSLLAGHPDQLIPGVEAVSGSLGHGLGIGSGLALAAKKDRKNWRTVILLGDGECQEGSVWEAAMFAGHHKLNNLIAIVDRNGLGSTNFTESIVGLEPFEDRWKAFGWRVLSCDGHDISAILSNLSKENISKEERPTVLVANTRKGKGVAFMENSPLWHHRMPKGEEISTARKELGI